MLTSKSFDLRCHCERQGAMFYCSLRCFSEVNIRIDLVSPNQNISQDPEVFAQTIKENDLLPEKILLPRPQELAKVYGCVNKCTNRCKRFKDQEQQTKYQKIGNRNCENDNDS